MRFLDFVLRNVDLLLALATSFLVITYVFIGVLSAPKYRYRRVGTHDSDAMYNILTERQTVEKISLWDRIMAFVHSHLVQFITVCVMASGFLAEHNIPSIKTPLITVALEFPRPLCSKPENRKLLLFIHGWDGDSGNTWLRFPSLACEDPRFKYVDVIVVDYPTFMARRNLNLAQLSSWLNEHLDFGEKGKYQRVAIIAHSMGGLVTREIIVLRNLNGTQKPIVAVVEVASPHLGANPAKLAAALGISPPLTDEMRAGSSFLITLQTEWQQIKTRPRTKCYTSPQDEVVSENSAISQCDDFTPYPQWGHRELVKPEDQADDRYSLPTKFLVPFFQ